MYRHYEMELKPDDRKYSRVTRRLVNTILFIDSLDEELRIQNIAESISSANVPEYMISRDGVKVSISARRIRDYIRYLVKLGIMTRTDQENVYELSFTIRESSGEWAQALSDLALPFIAELLGKAPENVPTLLTEKIHSQFANNHLPTINSICSALQIDEGRPEELFKWALYLYIDGPTCRFNITHSPTLVSLDD